MKSSDGLVACVHQKHGKTVSGEDSQRKAGEMGNHSVARQRAGLARTDYVDDIGMNLAKHHQGPWSAFVSCAHSLEKELAIGFDVRARVILGEAQIERVAAVSCGGTAGARAESVDEPGYGLKIRGGNNI